MNQNTTNSDTTNSDTAAPAHAIDASKLNKDSLMAAIKAAGLGNKIKKKQINDLPAIAAILADHYMTLGRDQLAQCDNCGGISDVSLDSCPFCGESDPDQNAPAPGVGADGVTWQQVSEVSNKAEDAAKAKDAKAKAKDAKAKPAPKDAKAKAEHGKIEPPAVDADAEAAKRLKAKQAKQEAAEKIKQANKARVEKLMAEKEAAKKRKEEEKKEKERIKAEERAKKAAEKEAKKEAKKNAIIKAEIVEVLPDGVTEESLDQLLIKYSEVRSRTAGDMWELGGVIRDLCDGQHWKARKAADGKPAYKNFGLFCAAELGMSAYNAYNMADVNKNFSKEQAIAHGTTKLALLLKAPSEGLKTELIAQLDSMSKRQVEEAVMKARNTVREQGGDPSRTSSDTGRQKTNPGKPKPKASTVTIVTSPGRFAVPMYKKGTQDPAKAIDDSPVGFYDFDNGTRIEFQLTKQPYGSIILQMIVSEPELRL